MFNYQIKSTSFFLMIMMTFIYITTFTGESYGEVYHDKIESFFSLIKESKMIESIDQIYAENPWILERASDGIQNLKSQMSGFPSLIGKYNKHVKIYEKSISDTFVHLSYLVAFDRQPVRFNFQFYKPKDKWTIFSFSFDDKINDEMEDAATLKEIIHL